MIIEDVEKVPRTTGFFEIVSVAFNLLSSWLTVASTLILGLSHGGSATVLYGLFVILIMYGAVALSLAEMAARYTTAGGQYHWTALLAPEKMRRGLVGDQYSRRDYIESISSLTLAVLSIPLDVSL